MKTEERYRNCVWIGSN